MNMMLSILAGLSFIAPALLQASMAAGGLAAFALAARQLGKGRLPVCWAYGLGLLAMARLAFVVVPESVFGVPWPSTVRATPEAAGIPQAIKDSSELSPLRLKVLHRAA